MASRTRTELACLRGAFEHRLPWSRPSLSLLAARALNAKVNKLPDADEARQEFVDRLKEDTGLTDNMLFLLRATGLLP